MILDTSLLKTKSKPNSSLFTTISQILSFNYNENAAKYYREEYFIRSLFMKYNVTKRFIFKIIVEIE